LGGTVSFMFAEALLLILWKLLLLTALSVLLSTLTSPILGAIIVLAAYFIGHATGILVDLPGQFDNTAIKEVIALTYYAIPNLSNFDIWREYANGVSVPHSYVAWTMVYGAVYTGLLLFLACLSFHDRDV